MKTIILAAGQGTRLRPFTDHCPKCMVAVNGRSIIERQLETMYACGIKDGDIIIITGYREDVLRKRFHDTDISFVVNEEYEMTNMVYSLMCAKDIIEQEDDILISYGDIIYDTSVLNKALKAQTDSSVIVDDGWYDYWSARYKNPLDDAETLMFDKNDCLTEIGQKTNDFAKVQAQYIGLMRFRGAGIRSLLNLSAEAEKRSREGRPLWRTDRTYQKMYMTDLLQGMIDEGNKLKAIHIQRGWFEIDDWDDLKVAEAFLQ